jgi:hypothetical protein
MQDNNNDKVIQAWQDKIRSNFGAKANLYNYLFETMDNFYYRYLETTLDQNLKTQQLAENIWGARSQESSMVEALKLKQPTARQGIIELAKRVPKSEGPQVRYALLVEVKQIDTDQGHLIFTAEIDWGFPDFNDSSSRLRKQSDFKYSELAQFRKEVALRLEEVCEIFL